MTTRVETLTLGGSTMSPADPVVCALTSNDIECWPLYTPNYGTLAQDAMTAYVNGTYDWRVYQLSGAYVFNGQYVTISPFDVVDGVTTRFDNGGVPEVKVGSTWHYNPTTICNCALWHHTRYVRDAIPLPNAFWACIGRLQAMISPDGGIRYDYPFDGMPAGWTSSMAQGQFMSVMARTAMVSSDGSLVSQGNAALRFMLKPYTEGGNRSSLADLHQSLASFVSFEEYAPSVSRHTLNGFMFTLFGLYDWARLMAYKPAADGTLAGVYFSQGMRTLYNALPYYDVGGFSTYDLDHVINQTQPSVGSVYHRIHIAQLVALHSITKHPVLKQWAKTWAPSNQPIP